MEYAICDRIGLGTHLEPYRPAVADYGCSYVAVNKNDDRFFVKFDGGDMAGAIADARVFTLNRPLTDVLTTIQANFVNNKLNTKYGVTTNPITAGMTVQQVLDIFLAIVDDTAVFSQIKMDGNT